jgi:DNA-binding NarL/FixJ family response regulator
MQDDTFGNPLRRAAISADRQADERMPLMALWQELRVGSARVRDAFFEAERCYLVLDWQIEAALRAPLSPRRTEMLECFLCGEYPKALAARLEVSTSTISTIGKLALQQIGIDSSLARFHPLLAVSARAAREENHHVSGRFARLSYEGRELRVLGADRPDHGLSQLLSPAQYEVVRGLVEGKNYLEIARGRGTSARTVANQLAAVFRRLGVSGRGSLLSQLTAERLVHP